MERALNLNLKFSSALLKMAIQGFTQVGGMP
jgi:hypothetical protein